MKKRLAAFALALTLLLTLAPTVSALEPEPLDENLSWSFDAATGTLTISGEGEMNDFTAHMSLPTPWGQRHYDKINSVVIEDGVTSVGEAAFFANGGIQRVEIADSVTSIGGMAFTYCFDITDVYYAGTAEQWSQITIGEGNEDLISATVHYDYVRPEKPSHRFYDVSPDAWYHDTVYAAADAGLVAGNADGTFAPDGTLTWAQTVTFATRVAQRGAGEAVYTAADQTEIWYQVYVDYALAHGIIDVVPSDPNIAVTRGDAAVIFAAALGDAVDVNTVPDGYFTDVAADSAAYDAVYTLARAGIVNGKLDTQSGIITFGTGDTFKRSEVATIVARMADLVPKVTIQ